MWLVCSMVRASNLLGILVAQFRVWQLHHGMRGVVIEALVEHLQNFDGGA